MKVHLLRFKLCGLLRGEHIEVDLVVQCIGGGRGEERSEGGGAGGSARVHVPCHAPHAAHARLTLRAQ